MTRTTGRWAIRWNGSYHSLFNRWSSDIGSIAWLTEEAARGTAETFRGTRGLLSIGDVSQICVLSEEEVITDLIARLLAGTLTPLTKSNSTL